MHSTAEALDERTPLLLHTSTDASSPPYTDDDQYPDGCRISRRASHRSFVAEVERTRRARFTVYPRDVSLVLENSGSVARDHLASERTFLAYVRTSLTIASAAVGECLRHPSWLAGSGRRISQMR
jgi:hypothetical protein